MESLLIPICNLGIIQGVMSSLDGLLISVNALHLFTQQPSFVLV